VPLSATQDAELDDLLGTLKKPRVFAPPQPGTVDPPGTYPMPPKVRRKTPDQEVDEILSGDATPQPAGEDTSVLGGLANLKNLPKLVTEGLPAAARAYVQRAGDPTPTYGQQLRKAAPWLPIIPEVEDLIARVGRHLSGLTAGAAELGPEQAKPLTETLANIAMGGPRAIEMVSGVQRGTLGALRRPKAPPPPIPPGPVLPPTTNVLGPSKLKPRPAGPPGQYGVYTTETPGPPSLPGPSTAPPPRAALAQRSAVESAAPMTWNDLADRARSFNTVDEFKAWAQGNRAVRQQLRQGPYTAEDFYRTSNAPPAAPPGPPQPSEAPPDTVAPPAPPAPRPAPAAPAQVPPQSLPKSAQPPSPPPPGPLTPNPELALRDYMAPGGTKVTQQIGDETVTWTKTDRNEWQGWVAGQHRKLTGESALNLAANPPAPSVSPQAPVVSPRPRIVSPPAPVVAPAPPSVPRATPPELGTPAAPLRFEMTPEGPQGLIGDLPKPSMPTRPTRAKVPQADLTAGGLFGQEAEARARALEGAQGEIGTPVSPPPAKPPRVPFQRTGEYAGGAPNLSDPNDVFRVVQAHGKIKVGEDLAGELRDVPPLFKNQHGQSLDRIAESLVDDYPHLGGGDRAVVKEQLLDTMRGYTELRRAQAVKVAREKAGGFDVQASVTGPKIEGSIAPEDSVLKQAMQFFADLGQDETGALNLANFSKAWKKQREKLPMETAVLRARPNSPVISAVERATSRLADWTQQRVNMPWHKGVRAADPEALKDAEVAAIAEWTRNGQTAAAELAARHHFPPAVQAAMKQRDVLFDQANKSRAYFGLDPIDRQAGPYLPRVVTDGRDAVSLRGEGLGGQSLRNTTPAGHGAPRIHETYRAGEAQGLEYEDPRNAILLRDWNDLKIRATHSLFKELEDRGAIFRDQAAATQASPTGRPWKIEGAPGGVEWWTPTEAEAKFLKQNLAEQRAPFGTLVHYANAMLRNPNLVNPLPHIVKNMAYKELLAQGPVSMSRVVRDAIELKRGTNPQMIADFHEAMPFSMSGRTASEALHRGLVEPSLPRRIVKGTLEAAGMVNRPSQKIIFQQADPAMRYALFKHYRDRGFDKFEAANHAWVDLIRYGTRSERTDFWKSVPLNFFVPWRFGTLVSLLKQVKNHPVRTALTISAAEYIRESVYRNTGYWWHMPTDYAQKPLAAMAQSESLKEAGANLGTTALTTALLGPGGDFSAKQLEQAIQAMQGKENTFEYDRLKNAIWGLSQIWNMKDEFQRGDYGAIVGTALLGGHRAYTYEPRRFTRALPESLPGMQKSAGVREAEAMQQERREKFQRREERRRERGKPPSIEDRLRSSGYIR